MPVATEGRYIVPLDDSLESGELASLVGTPIYNNGDTVDLVLTTDEWVALLARRRLVGWPMNYAAKYAAGQD